MNILKRTSILFLIMPHPMSPTLSPDRNTYSAFSAASMLEQIGYHALSASEL